MTGSQTTPLHFCPTTKRPGSSRNKTLYLLGTEAPDNKNIPAECGGAKNGYDDRNKRHSVEWSSDLSAMTKHRAAVRAQEEYDKAAVAFQQGKLAAAAFYLGAMAHYVGDVSQYGHAVPFETKPYHSGYESWAANRTKSFDGGHFESFIQGDGFVRRRAYTAVKRISRATAKGGDAILSATEMEAQYSTKGQVYPDSVAHSLNLGVNELTDVLHTFFLNVVSE